MRSCVAAPLRLIPASCVLPGLAGWKREVGSPGFSFLPQVRDPDSKLHPQGLHGREAGVRAHGESSRCPWSGYSSSRKACGCWAVATHVLVPVLLDKALPSVGAALGRPFWLWFCRVP